MKENCAWCGRELAEDGKRGGRVRTDEGVLCEECTPVYFKTLSDPESRPTPRPDLRPKEKGVEEEGSLAPAPPESRPCPKTDADPNHREANGGPQPSPEPPSEPDAPPTSNDETAADAEEDAEPEEGPDPLEVLDEIRRQVNQIRQTILYEKTSAWNVLGAVAQCFTLCALAFAAVLWPSSPQDLLLLAILLQLMALTFFFNGR